ncbi:redoxin domain-containing protein [Ralstonia pickettii]|nr:redoxin domain-containing protein [Ralstonia pickettii]
MDTSKLNFIQLENLNIGEKAPLFRTYNEKGIKVIAKNLYNKRKTLILFISTNCPVCKEILTDIKNVTSNYDLNFLIINSDELSNDKHITEKIDHSKVNYIRSNQITSLYFIRNVPYGLLIDERGIISLSNYIKDVNVLYNMLLNEQINTKPVSV